MAQKGKSVGHQLFIQSFLYVLGSILLTFILIQLPIFHNFINSFGTYGYVGALLAGMLFVSVFTAAPAVLLLFVLAETHAILPLAIVAGLGAVFGDSIIASVILRHAMDLKKLPEGEGIMKTIQILRHSKYRFLVTILGAIIIASPLPDELGLALMGLSNIKRSYFLWLTFALNTLGIYLLLSVIK